MMVIGNTQRLCPSTPLAPGAACTHLFGHDDHGRFTSPRGRALRGCFTKSLLLCAILSGCASTPPPGIYLLAPQADASTTNAPASGAPALQLQRISLPDYLDTTDILMRTGPHELQASTTAQWGERLSAGIAHALRADLTARLPQDRITLEQSNDPSAQQILVTVDALDMWPDGHCVLDAHWQTGHRGGQGVFTTAADGHATDEMRVAKLAGLIAELAGRIATDQSAGGS